MMSEKILAILRKDSRINEFLDNIEDFEILYKKLNFNDIKRLSLEYPNFFNLNVVQKSEISEGKISIGCLTLIKHKSYAQNFNKLKKIKIYVNEINEEIIKILQN